MMMCLFGKLLNRLRIVLGYWCDHYNEQCMRNGRSMPIEGKTTTLSYVGITFAVVQWPKNAELQRELSMQFFFPFFFRPFPLAPCERLLAA